MVRKGVKALAESKPMMTTHPLDYCCVQSK